MAHVSQKKKDTVAKLDNQLKGYSVIGIANLYGVPASQLQKIREKLRANMHMIMAKRSLIKLALETLEKDKKGVTKLLDNFSGMPTLILTNETPFKLAKVLSQNKTSAPAKAGQIAPNDINISAGPTPFTPGPVIGELGQLGIKSAVENGKIAIKADKVVVKEGEEISAPVASILARLGVNPMEIGINLSAAWDNGDIYKKDILEVDEAFYLDQMRKASSEVFTLTVELGLITTDNVEYLLQKAHREAFALATEEGVINKETVELILQKANAESASLKVKIPEE